MRPRPFKFFFGLAIGAMLLFFVARVFIAALIFAAIASTAFFIFRSIGNFFRNLDWRNDAYDFPANFARHPRQIEWRENAFESLADRRFAYEDSRREEIIIPVG